MLKLECGWVHVNGCVNVWTMVCGRMRVGVGVDVGMVNDGCVILCGGMCVNW